MTPMMLLVAGLLALMTRSGIDLCTSHLVYRVTSLFFVFSLSLYFSGCARLSGWGYDLKLLPNCYRRGLTAVKLFHLRRFPKHIMVYKLISYFVVSKHILQVSKPSRIIYYLWQMKFESRSQYIHLTNCVWKCCLQCGSHVVSTSMSWLHPMFS